MFLQGCKSTIIRETGRKMNQPDHLRERIFNCLNEDSFNNLALEVFGFQYQKNPIFHQYCDLIHKTPARVRHFTDLPFLPVDFFRTHSIRSVLTETTITFTSSGTSGEMTSKHHLSDVEWYEKSFNEGFQHFYGDIRESCILALLPSYLERSGSSLVYMADHLIKASGHPESGFYLYDFERLHHTLMMLKQSGQKTILLGVTYALLDFASAFPFDFPELIVMETGGMKGRRREMIREEVHAQLCANFGVQMIHSEYGMTELLSQAYSSGKGIFKTPTWMKILIRDTNDPLSLTADGKTGGINIIDLANVESCSFIAVQDLGRRHQDGNFEVLGRFDQSQIRGCNLMVE
jgi:hypothetical protein